MSSSSGAAAPVFSYAQAAKGLASAASTQSTPRTESPAASEKSAKDRPINETTNTSSGLKSPRLRSEAGDRVTDESATSKATTPGETVVTLDLGNKDGTGQSQHGPAADNDSASGSHMDPVSNKDSEKAEAGQRIVNGRKPSSNGSTAPAAHEHDPATGADKKSKDGEDDWEKVSVPSIPAETHYKAAPPPSFNVWQVRMETQAAKIKDQQKPIVPGTSSQPKKSRSASEDLKRKPPSREQDTAERETKIAESTTSGPRKDMSSARSSRPTSQQDGKPDAEVPPPVIDSQSWPTPEISNVDDRRKSASYEKSDKSDTKPAPQKSHGKTWKTLPFVPTAKFETQLPPAAARRGGGRSNTRGGRESNGRGGGYAGTSAEKSDAATSMGPPPLPRQSGEQDRGRRSEGQPGVRGASVPTSITRPASGDDSASTFRMASAADAKEQSFAESIAHIPTEQQTIEDQAARTAHSSRSSSRHTGNANARRVNGERSTPLEQASGVFPQNKEANPRYVFTDRSKAPTSGGLRGNGEAGRERGSGKVRDWSRDKPESAREKVESWRDRESSGDQGTRRGGRNDRARAGYRPRGDHSSYNQPYNASGAYTSPLPQNGFEPPPRSTSNTESRSRQTSQPFVPTQATSTPRSSNPRSQSIPVGMMHPGYYNGMPAVSQQGLPAIQTDMSMYGYPSQMQMQPSIMSAMPYNDPLNSYALLSMVMTQIEYYFSIDNLCKDLFLRKHMDGQGYVPLGVIANFKRIKTLTEDNLSIDNLRYVCQQVKSVEFLPGTDGDDRLRRREGWRDFVLPIEERFETARNDGPLHIAESYNRAQQQFQAGPHDPSFGFGHLRSPPLNGASINGTFQANSPMSYLSAAPEENQVVGGPAVRPFDNAPGEIAGRVPAAAYSRSSQMTARSPPDSTAPLDNIVNGHHRQSSRADIEENVFPDDQIPNVNIRMQPQALSGAAPSFPGLSRVASGGSSSARNESNNMSIDASQARLPGLRGGAGSPGQLEQFRTLSFSHPSMIPLNDENIIYFTKDGHETHLPPPQPGQYDQTYQSLHDVAFEQRRMGVTGALEPLYNFWTDFLVDKFNLGMYQEFSNIAISEQQEGNDSGILHLVRFFGKILAGPAAISERLASDMVNLSREDKIDKRPVLQVLRAAWRNGATNMKTIKRLGDVLSAEEKAELDKSG
ncbi:hypothetical protein H2200_006209 [Cladophialophora chaetospira]|uniref:HTH La-type RNA-binding domain-containing protein n=1 Tax=Cladophialophora chaetospira TaxID=386627 RepID=A0AA38XB44_9EURO|nr:hypothetical protein H2200_006209 [Cladophialophora chaetospira]